jgi:hypothetical protein
MEVLLDVKIPAGHRNANQMPTTSMRGKLRGLNKLHDMFYQTVGRHQLDISFAMLLVTIVICPNRWHCCFDSRSRHHGYLGSAMKMEAGPDTDFMSVDRHKDMSIAVSYSGQLDCASIPV